MPDLPRQWLPLDEALKQYFDAVPQSRKMVALVPRGGVSSNIWACRQALKRDLVAEIEKSMECAAV